MSSSYSTRFGLITSSCTQTHSKVGQASPSSSRHWPDTWLARSPQEVSGISVQHPAQRSEYSDRYQPQISAEVKPDYVINPNPEFECDGQSMQPPDYSNCSMTSEYEVRYQWPDPSALPPTPWTKKF